MDRAPVFSPSRRDAVEKTAFVLERAVEIKKGRAPLAAEAN
jgi:hypothetical protein